MGHGGARAGSGRKRQTLNVPHMRDPLKFLVAVMNDDSADMGLRLRAAVTLGEYNWPTPRRRPSAPRRLKPGARPRLVLVKGRKG